MLDGNFTLFSSISSFSVAYVVFLWLLMRLK